MELFYAYSLEGNECILDNEEARHCIKVLRHRVGDEIDVIDGRGCLMHCRLVSNDRDGARAEILSVEHGWGSHPYRLTMAVCPTKNLDRYEWFAEKACEIGVDIIAPIIGDHSERKVFKPDRLGRILVSAAKQSLKAAIPQVDEVMSVKDFILRHGVPNASASGTDSDSGIGKDGYSDVREDGGILRLIAYCFESEDIPRISIKQALEGFSGSEVIVMIGPEGDFSQSEADLAFSNGFIPIHLGSSRLRTETAAVTAVEALYFRWME